MKKSFTPGDCESNSTRLPIRLGSERASHSATGAPGKRQGRN